MSEGRSNECRLNVATVIRGRRTIGAFRKEMPPREVVLESIEIARWAPNHKKTEPWHVVWLGPETVRAVIDLNSSIIESKKGPVEAEAKRQKWAENPGWLVVLCDLADDALRREEDYAACCCFIQNLCLALWASGIGTKWSTGDVIRDVRFSELLRMDPSKQRVVGLIWYGYPNVIPDQTRRSVDQFVRDLP